MTKTFTNTQRFLSTAILSGILWGGGIAALSTAAMAAPKKGTPAVAKAEPAYAVDTQESSVAWEGRKVGGGHHGKLKVKEGSLKIVDGKLAGGEVTVDMTTLSNDDLTDAKSNGDLVGHLKSDDFFSVAKNPTSKLVIESVQPAAAAPGAKAVDPKQFEIKGQLTIKGITKPIAFPATVEIVKDQAKVQATAKVDRTAYDIRFRSGKFFPQVGDKLIHDEFSLTVNLVAKKSK